MSEASAPQSIVDRAQNFISENKQAVLVGSAVAAVTIGGIVYYASSSSKPPPRDLEKAKSKRTKKKKTVNDPDGPILEERKRPSTKIDVPAFSSEQVEAMSKEERAQLASSLKAQGNAAYQKKHFAEAAEVYTRAIEVSPKKEPVFYSNRAACYMNLDPPKYELVVEDCDVALSIDLMYIKPLNRRAQALEGSQRYEEAIRDYTAAAILEKFQNPQTSTSVERVLKTFSETKAREILTTRDPQLPSVTYVKAYFSAFRSRPLPTLPETPSTGDSTLLLATQAIEANDFIHGMTLINESIEQGISWDHGKAEALNLRGTFKFLTGDIDGAEADLEESIKLYPDFTQSLVKIASVHMEQRRPDRSFVCFETAIKYNPDDPDIYYHRGQIHFIMSEYAKAAEDYKKSTELDDDFVFSHIQLAVAQYKQNEVRQSMASFRRTLEKFPDRSEPFNYYGELLLDQQKFDEAIDKFDRSYDIEKGKPIPNVLPLVNKGLALYQGKQDIGAVERLCHEALRIDPACEPAVGTLAQLSLQRTNIPEAIKYFERQIDLSRGEQELQNALSYLHASKAQIEFQKNYPAVAAQLVHQAAAMM